jgi:polyvinyl alcohol dehydrogenase (cytochrome)
MELHLAGLRLRANAPFCDRGVNMLAMLVALIAITSHAGPVTAADDWPMFGRNLQNIASGGKSIKDVTQLAPRWTFTTGGDVSARAAAVKGVVYFPDWAGNLFAVDAKNGTQVWVHQLSDYGLPANTTSSTSPAVQDGVLYIGTIQGAWLLAIDASNGDLLWKTQLESPANDAFAVIKASPAVYDGHVYTGVGSIEDSVAANPTYPCCHARGSVVAVNATTGQIEWKTYMTPSGYSGAPVTGSNSVIVPSQGTLFVGTEHNFSVPTDPAYVACISNGGTPASCTSPFNLADSIVALNLGTGAIKWATRMLTWNQPSVTNGSDYWNWACVVGFAPGQGNCPVGAGPGYGFSSAPNFISYQTNGINKTILGAGEKSGIYYALDPDTGAVVWRTQVGPGSFLGGMATGSASDGQRIYVSIANLYGIPTPVGAAGLWSALDPATGVILWMTGDPNGAIALGPLTASDGVVYASSMASSSAAPTMLALRADTGQIVWSYAAGSSVNAGATVSDRIVYWGSGYTHSGIPGYTANNKFFAFSYQGK